MFCLITSSKLSRQWFELSQSLRIVPSPSFLAYCYCTSAIMIFMLFFFVFQPFVCQVLFGLALVLSNILMLQNFNKALQASKTTLEASIINTASNFVFTVSICFVHSIFFPFGSWNFDHFSYVIFFLFFPSCPSFLAKCKQRLCNIFVTLSP